MFDNENFSEVSIIVVILALILDILAAVPDLCLLFTIYYVIPLAIIIFVVVFVLVTLIQHFVEKDTWGVASLKASLWAFLTAIPLPWSVFFAHSYFKKKGNVRIINKAVSTGNNRNENGEQNIGDFQNHRKDKNHE